MKIAKSGISPEMIAAIGLESAAQDVTTLVDRNYRPFAHCNADEERQWWLWILFLVLECDYYPEGAWLHVEWVQQGQYKTPCDWLVGEGLKWRQRVFGKSQVSEAYLSSWQSFLFNQRLHCKVRHVEIGITAFNSSALRPIQKRILAKDHSNVAKRARRRTSGFRSRRDVDPDRLIGYPNQIHRGLGYRRASGRQRRIPKHRCPPTE